MSDVWDAKANSQPILPLTVAAVEDYIWYVRDMPAAASCVLLGKIRLYAGDWDGNLRAWDGEGEQLWHSEAEDRVERMCGASDANPPFICATSGNEVNCLDAKSGEEQWRHTLIGSSDLVACSDDGERVLATSSVYEIELNDFIESTCWRFDGNGAIVRQDTFEERPWHLLLDGVGYATMGLGRPRCGLMRQTDEESNHLAIAEDNPILCGATSEGLTVFGHASGLVSILGDDGVSLNDLDDSSEESVHVMASDGELTIAGGDDGKVRALSTTTGKLWDSDLLSSLDECTIAFDIQGDKSCWLATWDGLRATLWVLSSAGGVELTKFSDLPRVRALTSRDDRVAVGLDDGRVLLFNKELFERRLGDGQIDDGSDELADPKRSSLKDRLRALRE
ncbi:MAG: PQQ-binding-like beta-propeller repeat protein [Candidatus Thalassarchaeaceae archaeon]|nr:PQQ-binding-like beta-propeller repeat protein [Candidatus Thalassarchaeaceae archaeon]